MLSLGASLLFSRREWGRDLFARDWTLSNTLRSVMKEQDRVGMGSSLLNLGLRSELRRKDLFTSKVNEMRHDAEQPEIKDGAGYVAKVDRNTSSSFNHRW